MTPADRPQEPESRPACATCQDRGHVSVRLNAEEWEQKECPDCPAGLPECDWCGDEMEAGGVYSMECDDGSVMRLCAPDAVALWKDAADERRDLLRATCQERDTLRGVLAEVIAAYDAAVAPRGNRTQSMMDALGPRNVAARAAARAVLREVPANPGGES